ncbi:internal scaffolding protein [Sigmofec virus UA08Rod_5935]|uniref:Internal scaffolding protein n=1 Tax=Sigmofec virus UA08Rod_5935 TaxID=2929446 RepID=A0A976R6V4_9VIRU|nr:internal scaffolding protein [Sigmofec virus UA08Rod_5935]
MASENVKALPDFNNQFEARTRRVKNVGSGEKVLYTSRLAEDGTIELIESGKQNLYAEIQSHKDSCDIHILLARYQNGDPDALSRVQGAYGDFTELPKTYAELLNAVIAGEQMFMSLPVEIREKFDHSVEKFMVAMDDMPKFMEMMGYEVSEKDSGLSRSNDPADSSEPVVQKAD